MGERCGSEDPPLRKLERELNAETLSALREEKQGEGESDRMDCPSELRVNEENMGKGSMCFDYC